MAPFGPSRLCAILFAVLVASANGIDIYLEWLMSVDTSIEPVSFPQPVITINGMFPGPLINTTTNDFVHVNVFNDLDEPLLITWKYRNTLGVIAGEKAADLFGFFAAEL